MNLREILDEYSGGLIALAYLLFVIVVIVIVFLVVNAITSHNSQSNKVPGGTVHEAVHGQEVVLEHSNYDDGTGNTVYVYCDIPSMDRIYIVNHDHVTVEASGCKGLP